MEQLLLALLTPLKQLGGLLLWCFYVMAVMAIIGLVWNFIIERDWHWFDSSHD